MKQKDLLLIIIVGVFSAIFAVLLSKVLISGDSNRQQKYEVVEEISDRFILPDRKYFSEQSIDPTRLITIGNNSNADPFKKETP